MSSVQPDMGLPNTMSEAEYEALPAGVAQRIEVVHGYVIVCESPTPAASAGFGCLRQSPRLPMAGSARRLGRPAARRYAQFMAYPLDPADYKAAAFLPEISRDIYLGLPEDVCKLIEVVDGWLVRCERPTPSHQGIQVNFVVALRDAVKRADARDSTCHRVVGDIDVLISEAPRFHFRSPDVVVYRCVDEERGRWGDRPYASDCVLVLEIVSADSVTTDIRDKRAEYAAAGIPHYWIVRMTNNNGPVISVDRLLLAYDGQYLSQELRVRGRDFHAVDTVTPFRLKLTWEQLDDGL